MKPKIYLDITGNLLLLEKYKKWISTYPDLATTSDGYYQPMYRILYKGNFGYHELHRETEMEILWELRNCTYLGKL